MPVRNILEAEMAKFKFPQKESLYIGSAGLIVLLVGIVVIMNKYNIRNTGQYIMQLANPTIPSPLPTPIYIPMDLSFTAAQVSNYLNQPANDFLPLYQATVKFPQDGVLELTGRISMQKIVRFIYDNDSGKVPPLLDTVFKYLPSISVIDLRCRLAITNNLVRVKTERLLLSKINFNRAEFQPDEMLSQLIGDAIVRLTSANINTLTIKNGRVYLSLSVPEYSPIFRPSPIPN